MTNYSLKEAKDFAKDANINGVDAFLRQPNAKEYDRVIIEMLLEDLLQAYIDMHGYCIFENDFKNIQRIVNMKVVK